MEENRFSALDVEGLRYNTAVMFMRGAYMMRQFYDPETDEFVFQRFTRDEVLK